MDANEDQLHKLAQDVGQACGMDITCTKDSSEFGAIALVSNT